MAHRLKTLFIAVMAVAAVSAVSASAAYAVPEFHSDSPNTTLTIKQDGPGTALDKTGHQVFDAGENGAITCRTITADADTTASTTTQITVTNIVYANCTFLGSPATVNMNGCDYLFTSSGGGVRNAMETGQVHVQCPVGSSIVFGIATCSVTVPGQTPHGPTNSITFHNIGLTSNNTTETTVEPLVEGITGNAAGAGCVKTGAISGTYTTGNALVTGDVTGTATMTAVWWA